MKRLLFLAALGLVLAGGLVPRMAQAHFIWLAVGEDGHLHVYFSESAEPDDPELLKHAENAHVAMIPTSGKPEVLALARVEDSLVAKVENPRNRRAIFTADKEFGVMTRGEITFLLRYFAKTGPDPRGSRWSADTLKTGLVYDLIPRQRGENIQVQVVSFGKPIQGAEWNVGRPGKEDLEGKTDEKGIFTFEPGEAGMHSIRVKIVEAKPGKLDGKDYAEIRNYVTLALPIGSTKPADEKPVTAKPEADVKSQFADLPELVTSFGGAIADGSLYVFGGHTGDAHSYSLKEQGHQLRRLKLDGKSKWEVVAEGPHLQGLALVAHEDKVIRIGGFVAKNAEGEEHDLWSQNEVAAFDPQTKKWQELPPLPEPRSSFDAAVLDGVIYVIGGWQLQGGSDSVWHKTAWKLDLNQQKPEWQAIPDPPFQRRALSVAAFDGKVYAIGGMQEEGGPSTRVDVFDPKTQKWSEAGNLEGDPMTGFGSSAFATGGNLYVSTIKGNLQKLNKQGNKWEVVQQTPTARFFHRMLPLDDASFLMVGGANMGIGKFEKLEVVKVK
jgi:N-acetylneuraminic acid mutarotase